MRRVRSSAQVGAAQGLRVWRLLIVTAFIGSLGLALLNASFSRLPRDASIRRSEKHSVLLQFSVIRTPSASSPNGQQSHPLDNQIFVDAVPGATRDYAAGRRSRALVEPAAQPGGEQRGSGTLTKMDTFEVAEGPATLDDTGPSVGKTSRGGPRVQSDLPGRAAHTPNAAHIGGVDEDKQYSQQPKVALLFLTRGAIPTEPLWHDFFRAAAQLTPKREAEGFEDLLEDAATPLEELLGQQLHQPVGVYDAFSRMPCWSPGVVARLAREARQAASGTQQQQEAQGLFMPGETSTVVQLDGGYDNGSATDVGHPLYRSQDLFSVYVHAPPGFEGFPSSSIFWGRTISNPVQAEFAAHSLVDAERLLLVAALADPRNTRFLMLSESCVPMYHPAVLYAQTLSEQRSRVDAQTMDPGVTNIRHRMHRSMITEHFGKGHWRKSSQWKMLTRTHARLVVEDRHLDSVFRMMCLTMDRCRGGEKICVSDEHYVASLLASYGMGSETNAADVTYTDWTRNTGWHPYTFAKEDFDSALLSRARRGHPWMVPPGVDCASEAFGALTSALQLFDLQPLSDEALAADQAHQALLPGWAWASSALPPPQPPPLPPPLLAAHMGLANASSGTGAGPFAHSIAADLGGEAAAALADALAEAHETGVELQHGLGVLQHYAQLMHAQHRQLLAERTPPPAATGSSEDVMDRAFSLRSRQLQQARAVAEAGAVGGAALSEVWHEYRPLHHSCPLLMRKVKGHALQTFVELAPECNALGLGCRLERTRS